MDLPMEKSARQILFRAIALQIPISYNQPEFRSQYRAIPDLTQRLRGDFATPLRLPARHKPEIVDLSPVIVTFRIRALIAKGEMTRWRI